jgi:YVTN family beta-propeller protein
MRLPLKINYSCLLLVTALLSLAFLGNCWAAVYGYIPNSGDNTVTKINTGDIAETTAINLGNGPSGVATSPDGKFIYVTNRYSNTVAIIDSQADTVTSLVVGTEPVGVAVSPDGAHVFVANQDGNLSVINPSDNRVETLTVGTSLFGVAVDRAGEFVYVTDDTENKLYTIQLADLTVIAPPLEVGLAPRGVAAGPLGNFVAVANSGDNTVSLINVATPPAKITTIGVGSNPFGVALSSDGANAFVTNSGDDTVSMISLLTSTVTATIALNPVADPPPDPLPLPDGPQGIALGPYGEYLYAVNNRAGTVKVVNLADNTVSATTVFTVGAAPVGLGNFFDPETPSGLTATLVGDTAIDLNWTDNANEETGYTIERRTYNRGDFHVIASVAADVTAYRDTNLDNYVNYYYRVKAVKGAGSTPYTDLAFAQTAKRDVQNCFIATAAYGSYWEPQVMTLRKFRDSFLLTNRLGSLFVKGYYEYSPPAANYIARHEILRAIVRIGLTPFIGFGWLAVNYGIGLAFTLGLCLVIGLLIVKRRLDRRGQLILNRQ